ncbi:GTP-binding protein At3g49725, chloroplastic [Lathyrus oleraceus]|nr:GTP-binding protein At3g49725, chloroplastic-like [Pisum sativum]
MAVNGGYCGGSDGDDGSVRRIRRNQFRRDEMLRRLWLMFVFGYIVMDEVDYVTEDGYMHHIGDGKSDTEIGGCIVFERMDAKLNEALCLANSLEDQRDGYFHTDFFDKPLPPHVLVQNPSLKGHKPRADTYFGPGTVDTIKCHLNAAETKGEVDAVFVNATLSGIQLRNMERAWSKPVVDRVGLIIEIFNAHAYTKEARLQAELAALSYKKSRLVRVLGPGGRYTFGASGEAEVVSARGRGGGGQGFMSGAGETELQLQRRRVLERRNYLLTQIDEVRRTRVVQRAGRKRHGGSSGHRLATVAVVGYTNAGKSTLVSNLTDSDLYSDCRLFATVDPRLRSAALPSGRKVLFSDTVGFISDLPVQVGLLICSTFIGSDRYIQNFSGLRLCLRVTMTSCISLGSNAARVAGNFRSYIVEGL